MSIRLPYAIFPFTSDPINSEGKIARPEIKIQVSYKNLTCKMLAVIDSGADFNMAPVELADIFEIDLSACRSIEVSGIEAVQPVRLFFAPVSIEIGREVIHTHFGFGGNLPSILLGQRGFFDKCREVTFMYPKHIEVKVKH